MLQRRCFSSIIVLVVYAAPCLHAAENRPNVLFLLTDDQRPDTIAALGNPAIRTPNLDALARRGFAFTHAYCMGSTMPAVCNPSRHMIHSGMLLYRYDPRNVAGTLGDTFAKAGYVTYHESKSGRQPPEQRISSQSKPRRGDRREALQCR